MSQADTEATPMEAVSGAVHDLFDTAPPQDDIPHSQLGSLKRRASDRFSEILLPIVRYAARSYIGGETIDDAMSVVARLAAQGFGTTLGYWDTGKETGRQIANHCLNAIEQLGASAAGGYVSIKPPALHFALELAVELAGAARKFDLRLHCDSHGPDVADQSCTMIEAMIDTLGAHRLGTTLPGRWTRSLRDAEWAIERGVNVRVVKGQWPDPADLHRELSSGFLAVIDALAGRARHVAVATQDFALAREAIARLRTAGTSCELELLFGMPTNKLISWARANGVSVRIYVPFGGGFVPSALRVLKRNPRLLLTIAREQLGAVCGIRTGN